MTTGLFIRDFGWLNFKVIMLINNISSVLFMECSWALGQKELESNLSS